MRSLPFLFPILFIGLLVGCVGRRPAEFPRNIVQPVQEEQVARAEKAAFEASENSRQCKAESEKLRRQIEELKLLLADTRNAERGCAEAATSIEKKWKIRQAAIKKKEEEEKVQALAQPVQTGVPEYSKSDAPLPTPAPAHK